MFKLFVSLFSTGILLSSCGGGSSSSAASSSSTIRTTTQTQATDAATLINSAQCEPTLNPVQESPSFEAPEAPERIIVLMFDDLDLHDFGYTSLNGDVVTPAIDALAADGKTFSRYYTASAICSPTRVSLLTGNSPLNYGLSRLWPDLGFSQMGTNVDERYRQLRGLPSSERTYVDVAKDAGYKSFHIGKWHVGTNSPEHLPGGQGFDDFQIMQINPDRGELNFFGPQGAERTESQTWRPAYQIDQIIDFIETNAEEKVFINYWPTEPHTPLITPPDFDNSVFGYDLLTRRGRLQAIMNSFDTELDRLVSYLKDNDLYDDTLIIVTSDNGGLNPSIDKAVSSVRAVSGGKGNLLEGGIRVPLSVTWPNQIEAATQDDSSVVVSYDIMPTLAAILEEPSGDVRGEDFRSALFSSSGFQRDKSALFEMRTVSWNTAASAGVLANQHALIDDCYKLTDVGEPRDTYKLYNLCDDPLESQNRAITDSCKFAEMVTEIETQRTALGLVFNQNTVTEPLTLTDHRLNIHHEDIYISGRLVSGEGNIYNRGEGISLSVIDGMLDARITGPTTLLNNDAIDTVFLSTPISNGDSFELFIQGYISSGSTIELIINGRTVRVAEATTALSANQLGNSVYAVRNQPDAVANVGASSISLSNLNIKVAR